MAGQWNKLTVQRCADVSGILHKLKGAGATLPAEISPEGGPLMDLAEIVVRDDRIWNGLPSSFQFNGENAEDTRQILRHLVRLSK